MQWIDEFALYKISYCLLGNETFRQHTLEKRKYYRTIYIISVLWRQDGYTVIYSLSPREIPRAEPEVFPEGSGYISPYILTWVIIQTLSILKSHTSNMSFLLWQYWKSWFSVLVWQLGYIFPWHVTRDTWHMTHTVVWTFSQNFNSLALQVLDWQCLENIWTKGSMNDLIN